MKSIGQLQREALEAQIRASRHTGFSAGRVFLILFVLGLLAVFLAKWIPVWTLEDDSAAREAMGRRKKALDAQAPDSEEPFRRMLSPR